MVDSASTADETAFRRHTESGGSLRVITTTYTGTTELGALEMLKKAGAQIRVSYDTSTTRLHAKAWIFHRAAGFSTVYVGSSNLTHSAQVNGLEWNVRASDARDPSSATMESDRCRSPGGCTRPLPGDLYAAFAAAVA